MTARRLDESRPALTLPSRVGRRSLLKGAAGLGLSVSALGGLPTTSSARVARAQADPTTLTIPASPNDFDPHSQYDYNSVVAVRGMYRGAHRPQGERHRRVRGIDRRVLGVQRRPERLDVPPPERRHLPGWLPMRCRGRGRLVHPAAHDAEGRLERRRTLRRRSRSDHCTRSPDGRLRSRAAAASVRGRHGCHLRPAGRQCQSRHGARGRWRSGQRLDVDQPGGRRHRPLPPHQL